jgi:hypothetical protein
MLSDADRRQIAVTYLIGFLGVVLVTIVVFLMIQLTPGR